MTNYLWLVALPIIFYFENKIDKLVDDVNELNSKINELESKLENDEEDEDEDINLID